MQLKKEIEINTYLSINTKQKKKSLDFYEKKAILIDFRNGLKVSRQNGDLFQ